jgi:hypothetical protein
MQVMPAFELSDLERKLLRLALCSSAQGGEIAASAQKLIESWLNRGVESVAIESALDGGSNGSEPVIRMSRPDYGLTTMPFGRHKGSMFLDIEPSYLRFIRGWINDAPDRAARFKELAEAIEHFLQQTWDNASLHRRFSI